jgi:CPA2 family monovalent cation:H+ antiporter-2
VVLCRSLKLPPMLGYLVVGVLIGPNALALAQDSDSVRHLGEFGVVFLMFVIGLEFNLPSCAPCARTCSGWAVAGAAHHAAGDLGLAVPGALAPHAGA